VASESIPDIVLADLAGKYPRSGKARAGSFITAELGKNEKNGSRKPLFKNALRHLPRKRQRSGRLAKNCEELSWI
jgi:hypothetical protein